MRTPCYLASLALAAAFQAHAAPEITGVQVGGWGNSVRRVEFFAQGVCGANPSLSMSYANDKTTLVIKPKIKDSSCRKNEKPREMTFNVSVDVEAEAAKLGMREKSPTLMFAIE